MDEAMSLDHGKATIVKAYGRKVDNYFANMEAHIAAYNRHLVPAIQQALASQAHPEGDTGPGVFRDDEDDKKMRVGATAGRIS